jgi:hypothetical protein
MTPAQSLLALMWDAGLLTHHLTISGPYLTTDSNARITLTEAESSLFYLCTEHEGVLAAGDERCVRHRDAALLEGLKRS